MRAHRLPSFRGVCAAAFVILWCAAPAAHAVDAAPIVDAFVVASINRRAFRPEDFEEAAAGEPVYLRRESLRWFLTLFERRMAKPVWYEPLGCRLAPRDLIEAQARAFARDVLGGEAYEPFRRR